MDFISKSDEIIYMTFNQDQGCFAIGTEIGFKIFNTSPFKETFSRDMGGGIGIIEMLYRTNILALVGGGRNPKYPLNKVMIWDDSQMKCIGEMSFRSEVKAVKLRPNRIVVILDNKIFIYNFADLKLLDHMDTCLNPKGLCSLNLDPENTVLACPDKLPGQVTIHMYGNFGAKDKKKITSIKAHPSALTALELNLKGGKLATACENGNIIKIYNTHDGSFLQELRRGSENTQLYSISFENSGRWLLCSSESGTINVFTIKLTENEKIDLNMYQEEVKNPKSKFAFMKVVLPYFDSEWSFAQLKAPDTTKTLVCFNTDSLIVISYEGNHFLCRFDNINGGECQIKKQIKFIYTEEQEK